MVLEAVEPANRAEGGASFAAVLRAAFGASHPLIRRGSAGTRRRVL